MSGPVDGALDSLPENEMLFFNMFERTTDFAHQLERGNVTSWVVKFVRNASL